MIGRKALLTLAAAAAIATGCAHDRPTGLQPLVAGGTERGPELAGLAVAVLSPERVLHLRAHGRAVIDPSNLARERPLTPDTPVRVASISKLVTALGVMRLVEAGVLDLDRDVSDYLGWRLRNPSHDQRPVTLRQLLSHTSSLVDEAPYAFQLGERLPDALQPQHWSTLAPPGARFSYANINYVVIGTIMEAATGERFDRLMHRLVLGPLGLDACYNWAGCSDRAVAAAGALYRRGEDETRWAPTGPWIAQLDDLRGQRPTCPVRSLAGCDLAAYRPGTNGALFAPQGGLRLSARGLATIARLLLGEGEVDGVRLLRHESVRTLLDPQWRDRPDAPIAPGETASGLMRCYGLGAQCLAGEPGRGLADQPLPGQASRWHGHLGNAYGLVGGLWIDPAQRRGYVYLVTGLGDDPSRYPGLHSRFSAFEEAILQQLVAQGAES